MVVLPPLILGLCSILIWLLKRSQIRLLRLITVIGSLIALLTSLILVTQSPSRIIFPGLGSSSQFALALDRDLWPVFMAISVSLFLRQLIDPIFGEGRISPHLLMLFSMVMLTISAGNGYSLLAAISAFDIVLVYPGLQRNHKPDLGNNLWKYYAASSLANLILFFLLISSRVPSKGVWMDGAAIQQVLIVLFILMRGWATGVISKPLTVHQEWRTRWSLAQSMALSLPGLCLVKLILWGVVSSEASLLPWAGGLILGWSSLRLLFGKRPSDLDPPLSLALLGAILLSVSIGTDSDLTAAIQLTALSFLSTAVSGDLSWLRGMERVIVVFVALMLTGFPATLGSPVSGHLSGQIATSAITIPAVVLAIGMSLIAGGFFKNSWPKKSAGESQRGLPPFVFAITFVAAGVLLRWLVPMAFDLIQISVIVGLMVLGWVSYRVLENRQAEILFPVSNILARVAQIGIDPQVWTVQIKRVISATAQIFEGEAGSLWMFVVIQIAIVLLGLANE